MPPRCLRNGILRGARACSRRGDAASARRPPPAGRAGPWRVRRTPDVSPGLAFFLGWIPGVGAIYNGQYAKGLVHAVIFGMLCSILDSDLRGLEPVFGILLAAWIFYMAFEAYHTARKRRNGRAGGRILQPVRTSVRGESGSRSGSGR